MGTLVDELVPDQLWAMVEPLLPVPAAASPYGGRRRAIPDRNCFAAVGATAYPAGGGPRGQGLRQRGQSGLAAAA